MKTKFSDFLGVGRGQAPILLSKIHTDLLHNALIVHLKISKKIFKTLCGCSSSITIYVLLGRCRPRVLDADIYPVDVGKSPEFDCAPLPIVLNWCLQAESVRFHQHWPECFPMDPPRAYVPKPAIKTLRITTQGEFSRLWELTTPRHLKPNRWVDEQQYWHLYGLIWNLVSCQSIGLFHITA